MTPRALVLAHLAKFSRSLQKAPLPLDALFGRSRRVGERTDFPGGHAQCLGRRGPAAPACRLKSGQCGIQEMADRFRAPRLVGLPGSPTVHPFSQLCRQTNRVGGMSPGRRTSWVSCSTLSADRFFHSVYLGPLAAGYNPVVAVLCSHDVSLKSSKRRTGSIGSGCDFGLFHDSTDPKAQWPNPRAWTSN